VHLRMRPHRDHAECRPVTDSGVGAQRPTITQGVYPCPWLPDRHVMRLPGPVRVLRPLGTEDCPLVVVLYARSAFAWKRVT
jgi:hypothetical protein